MKADRTTGSTTARPWDCWEALAQKVACAAPGALLHIPFDLASGLLGEDVTAVEEATGAETPSSYRLGAAYPNPFNPKTSIEFAVPVDEAG